MWHWIFFCCDQHSKTGWLPAWSLTRTWSWNCLRPALVSAREARASRDRYINYPALYYINPPILKRISRRRKWYKYYFSKLKTLTSCLVFNQNSSNAEMAYHGYRYPSYTISQPWFHKSSLNYWPQQLRSYQRTSTLAPSTISKVLYKSSLASARKM